MPAFFQQDPDYEAAEESVRQQRLAEQAAADSLANPELAQLTAHMADTYGTVMSPGATMALVREAIQAEDPAAQAIAERERESHVEQGLMGTVGELIQEGAAFGWHAVRDKLRGVFTAFEFGIEEGITRPFRAAVDATRRAGIDPDAVFGFRPMGDPDIEREEGASANPFANLRESHRRSGRSAGLIALQEGADLGQGIFPGGEAEALHRAEVGELHRDGGVDAELEALKAGRLREADLPSMSPEERRQFQTQLERNQERLKAKLTKAREDAVMYRGRPLSPGRFFGAQVFEPGSKPYHLASGMVDGAVQIFADPAFIGLSTAAKLKAARSAFRAPTIEGAVKRAKAAGDSSAKGVMDYLKESLGVIAGRRNAVDVDKFVDDFLVHERAGQNFVDWIRKAEDHEDVWEILGRPTNREIVNDFVNATDRDEVLDIARKHLSVDLPNRPQSVGRHKRRTFNFGFTKERSLQDLRLMEEIPGTHINVENPGRTIETFDQWLKNAKVDPSVRKGLMSKYFAADEDASQLMAVVSEAAREVDQVIRRSNETLFGRITTKLQSKGEKAVDFHAVQDLTRMFDDFATDLRAYATDEMGHHADVIGSRAVNDSGKITATQPKAHILAEYLNRGVPLPDFRDIRTATSKLGRVLNVKGVKPTLGLYETLMDKAWKPAVLLRGAWTVRVIGEEQARMAAAGMDSAYRHPISWFAWMTADEGALGKIARKIADPKGEFDLLDEVMAGADEFKAANQQRITDWIGGRAPSNAFQTYSKGDKRYWDAALTELRQLAKDDVARIAADPDFTWTRALDDGTEEILRGREAVKAWFSDEAGGLKFAHKLAKGSTDGSDIRGLVDDNIAQQAIHPGKAHEGMDAAVAPRFANSKEMRDYYVETVYKRLSAKTGDDADLLRGIAKGELNGKDLRNGFRGVDDSLKDHLRTLDEERRWAPDAMKGPTPVDQTKYDRWLDRAFDAFMGTPTSKLSRSPAFRQFYWARVSELAEDMSPALRAKVIKQMKKNNLHKLADEVRGVEGQRVNTNLLESFDEVDVVAKQSALDQTRDLLYDLDRRHQVSDILRNIIPFGEAWKEVLTSWYKIMGRRVGAPARRFQQFVSGAGEADWDGDGRGMFFTDPQTGEEQFVYPGLGWLMGKIAGGRGNENNTGIEAIGHAQGLNLVAASVLPGIGPGVQWPASHFIKDHPDWDWLRDAILPFGEQDADDIGGFIDAFLPAYAQKLAKRFWNGARDDRAWNNTVADVAKAKVLSGEYDPTEVDQALQAAANESKWLFFARGLAQSILPTGPSLDFQVEDKDGKWWNTQVLANEYRRIMDDMGGDSDLAIQQFIDEYGTDPLLLSQGRTSTIRRRSFTKAGFDWERRNANKLEIAPNTLGFFAPNHPEAEFHYPAYIEALELGDSQELTAEQQLKAYNNSVGWFKYNKAKNDLEQKYPDARQEDINSVLRQVKAQLKVEHPGFDSIYNTIPVGEDTKDLIAELEIAVQDPTLGETEAGQALSKYLAEREKALTAADGVSLSGKKDRDLRLALQSVGEELAEEHPDFLSMWTSVLSREVREDG